MSLWWRHNIYLWRHNGARGHTRAKHYEYFMLENWTQTTLVYWSKNPLYLYLVKQFKIESSNIFQILEYFQNFDVYFINQYLTVWGFTIALCFHKSHYFKNYYIFPFISWFLHSDNLSS